MGDTGRIREQKNEQLGEYVREKIIGEESGEKTVFQDKYSASRTKIQAKFLF